VFWDTGTGGPLAEGGCGEGAGVVAGGRGAGGLGLVVCSAEFAVDGSGDPGAEGGEGWQPRRAGEPHCDGWRDEGSSGSVVVVTGVRGFVVKSMFQFLHDFEESADEYRASRVQTPRSPPLKNEYTQPQKIVRLIK
jgi:hypothetical protein